MEKKFCKTCNRITFHAGPEKKCFGCLDITRVTSKEELARQLAQEGVEDEEQVRNLLHPYAIGRYKQTGSQGRSARSDLVDEILIMELTKEAIAEVLSRYTVRKRQTSNKVTARDEILESLLSASKEEFRGILEGYTIGRKKVD